VSSLWTPGGEHSVPRSGDPAPDRTPPQPPSRPPSSAGDPQQGEGPASEEEVAALAREIAAAPVEAVVANHCYGLFELAALHLSQRPPNLRAASLAIDAMGLLVDGLADRLGESAVPLAEGLSQVRLAFVKIAEAEGATPADGSDPEGAGKTGPGGTAAQGESGSSP
jgi:hypothetical protein